MAAVLIAFDLRRGQILVGDVEQLGKLLSPGAPAGSGSSLEIQQSLPGQPGDASTSGPDPNGHRTSVREFARRFVHRRVYERIAILKYYGHWSEGRATVTTRELSDWFGLCGFKTPTRMDKALDNVMRQRHIVERRGVGQWALTAAGESVALDLLESTKAAPDE